MNNHYPFELMELPYAYDALEPHISQETMMFHHDKHLQTYVDNLNQALAKQPSLQNLPLEYLLTHLDEVPVAVRTAVQNNGGGVYNHNFFFEGMSPDSTKPSEELNRILSEDFGSVREFLEELKGAAISQFGSGWAWLVLTPEKKLKIVKTDNQITPLKDRTAPLLAVDVWEHAYYLDYQNRRPDYVSHWEEVINWNVVSERLNEQNL